MNRLGEIVVLLSCIVLHLGTNVRCDKHQLGSYRGADVLYEKYLLLRNSTVPTNYTIDFRFSGFTDINVVEVNVNCKSQAVLDLERKMTVFDNDVASAAINVTNCKNVSVFLGLYGYSIGGLTFTGDLTTGLFESYSYRPKISTKIYLDEMKNNPIISSGRRQLDDRLLEYKRIISKNTEIPTNYTIFAKYSFQNNGEIITYVEIGMKNNFTGSIYFNSTTNSITAKLNVINALNMAVILKVYGIVERTRMDFDENLLDPDLFRTQLAEPKSFTIFYNKNKSKAKAADKSTNNESSALGQRQPNDRLLDVQTKTVNIFNRFARDDFIYEDKSKLITMIEFSFDSPTAVAMINSSFVNEHGVEAVVYDLNRPTFSAKFSVYGYDQWNAPRTYKPIIFNKSL